MAPIASARRPAPSRSQPVADPVGEKHRELTQFLDQHRHHGSPRMGGFEAFEERVLALSREVARAAIAQELEALDVAVEAIEVQGKTLRRVLRSKQTYLTVAGTVEVERWLYKDRHDEASRSLSPLEVSAGIVAGFWTPAAAKQGAWVVAQMTPGKAEELFERVGSLRPSKSSLERLPKALSERWEEQREDFEQQLRETLSIPAEATTVAVSVDGVLAPMEGTQPVEKRQEAARRGRICKGPVGYREFGVATLSFCDEQGEMLTAVRMGRSPEAKKATLKGRVLAEVLGALGQRPDLRLVMLADAGGDNGEFLGELAAEYPGSRQAIDFFHATEHLHAAVAAAYGEATRETQFRYEELKEKLREQVDGAAVVIRALGYLAKKFPHRTRIGKELAYFRKNKGRMGYAALKAEGYPIGSGVVEAACKTMVTQRLKLSGMRWGSAGAQAILTLRGWDQSDRFDEAWALLAATYACEVHILAHVVPIKRPSR